MDLNEPEHRGSIRKRRGEDGFTLVELMIVVAIIGALSAVAIPKFLNYQLTSKRVEAFSNLSALSKAQQTYFAEYNTYIGVDAEPLGGGQVPTTTKRDGDRVKAAFSVVGWAPDGDVFYDYDTMVPNGGGPGACTCTEACFTAAAYGDLDGDGALSVMLYVQPDGTGTAWCTTRYVPQDPPENPVGSGNRVFQQVIRSEISDQY